MTKSKTKSSPKPGRVFDEFLVGTPTFEDDTPVVTSNELDDPIVDSVKEELYRLDKEYRGIHRWKTYEEIMEEKVPGLYLAVKNNSNETWTVVPYALTYIQNKIKLYSLQNGNLVVYSQSTFYGQDCVFYGPLPNLPE